LVPGKNLLLDSGQARMTLLDVILAIRQLAERPGSGKDSGQARMTIISKVKID